MEEKIKRRFSLSWSGAVCICVTTICAMVLLMPLTWTEHLAIKIVAEQEMNNLRNSIRFAAIETQMNTVVSELYIYRRVKNFNRKFLKK